MRGPPLEYGRTYTVQVAGTDALGDSLTSLNGPTSFSFGTKVGYKFDAGFAATDLGSRTAVSGNRPATYTNLAIDRNDRIFFVDPNTIQVLIYDSAGNTTGVVNIPASLITFDTNNNLWGYIQSSNPATWAIQKYAADGTVLSSISKVLPVSFGAEVMGISVDPAHSVAYLGVDWGSYSSSMSLLDGSLNLLSVTENSVTNPVFGCPIPVDSSGNVYVVDGFVNPNVLRKLSPTWQLLSKIPLINSASLATAGPDDSLYFLCRQNGTTIERIDRSGRVTNAFVTEPSVTALIESGLNHAPRGAQGVSLAADSKGRIYIELPGGQVVRYLPDP